MKTLLVGVLKTLLTKKFLISVFIDIAEWLAKQSDTKLDDKLVGHVKEALK